MPRREQVFNSPQGSLAFAGVTILLLGVSLTAYALWRFGAMLFFAGNIAVLSSILGDSTSLDPRIGYMAAVAIVLLVYLAQNSTKSMPGGSVAIYGTVLLLYSALSLFFSDPIARRVPDPEKTRCFGIFGESRCLVVDESASRAGVTRDLYRIGSIFQVPKNKTLYSPQGSPLRFAAERDLLHWTLNLERLYSIRTGDCFDSQGRSSCMYRTFGSAAETEGYVLYKLHRSFKAGDLPEIFDTTGTKLTLVTSEMSKRIHEWEQEHPDLAVRSLRQ